MANVPVPKIFPLSYSSILPTTLMGSAAGRGHEITAEFQIKFQLRSNTFQQCVNCGEFKSGWTEGSWRWYRQGPRSLLATINDSRSDSSECQFVYESGCSECHTSNSSCVAHPCFAFEGSRHVRIRPRTCVQATFCALLLHRVTLSHSPPMAGLTASIPLDAKRGLQGEVVVSLLLRQRILRVISIQHLALSASYLVVLCCHDWAKRALNRVPLLLVRAHVTFAHCCRLLSIWHVLLRLKQCQSRKNSLTSYSAAANWADCSACIAFARCCSACAVRPISHSGRV